MTLVLIKHLLVGKIVWVTYHGNNLERMRMSRLGVSQNCKEKNKQTVKTFKITVHIYRPFGSISLRKDKFRSNQRPGIGQRRYRC